MSELQFLKIEHWWKLKKYVSRMRLISALTWWQTKLNPIPQNKNVFSLWIKYMHMNCRRYICKWKQMSWIAKEIVVKSVFRAMNNKRTIKLQTLPYTRSQRSANTWTTTNCCAILKCAKILLITQGRKKIGHNFLFRSYCMQARVIRSCLL